jgi:predicted enzyme related to lactoylglutathione lyase
MQLLINIDVDDLDRAVEFYRSGLGLHPRRRLFGGSVVEMSGAASRIFLLAKASGSLASPTAESVRIYDRHWTPVHLDFEVDEITAAVQRALAAGAELEGEIQSMRWGQLATLSDPFGHGFCLIQFSGKNYDEIA